MLRNYFKVAFRNLFRTKLYSSINIAGLTLGIACSTLLALYVLDESRFDKFHKNGDNIYRLILTDDSSGEIRHYGVTQGMLGSELVETYPEVEKTTRLWQPTGQVTFNHRGERLSERGWFMADSEFLNFFDFELISGDRSTALLQPNSIVLTESMATKYFGDEDPMGKTIYENRKGDLIVTGLLKDIPSNSHLQFDMLISMDKVEEGWEAYLNNWGRFGTYTYLRLSEDANENVLSSKILELLKGKMGEEGATVGLYMQHLYDIHFHSASIEFGVDENKGDLKYVYFFIAIGVFILLIAAINYVNLATARAMQRAREIGVRKASGAQRNQLIAQFMSESTVIAVLSFILAIGLVDLMMPYFQSITQREGIETSFSNILIVQFALTTIIGLLSGIYPALYLSKLKPAAVLRGDSVGKTGERFRRVLVISQFSLSIFMIIATLVVYQQLNYITQLDLGFNKEHIVVVDINNGNVRNKFEEMKTEFSKHSNVINVAASSRVPGEWKNIREVYVEESGNSADSIISYYMAFDEDMISTFDFSLLIGANFSGNRSSDSTKIILNEAAVRALNLPEDPIGSVIKVDRTGDTEYTVIGVVKDFNFQSLHSEIAPLLIGFWNAPIQVIDYFSIKISDKNLAESIAHITEVHGMFDQSTPIEYHFLNEQIDSFYQNETRAGKIFSYGASLVIFIACLGLFGLASFMIQKRTKEIGIRKVLGASTKGLYFLISTSFLKQVLIAWVIAVPLSYFAMSAWLKLFTYSTGFDVKIVLVAGLAACLVALLTVSYRSISASLSDPAKTLKCE